MNRFKRSVIVGGIATTILIGSANLTFAQSMENFTQINSYNNGIYNDVKSTDWFYNDVRQAYNLDLMKGVGYCQFNPSGSMTFAEAITLAANIHKTYHEKAIIISGDHRNWYEPYVLYARENNIIDLNSSDYNRKITRAELVHLFDNSIPNSELNQINNITNIPDIGENTPYRDVILKLYNAGIIRGTGDEGVFNPQTNISRAETAAILNRLVNKNNRIKFSLKDTEDITDNIALKKKIKSILDHDLGYYLPRFEEGKLDENEAINAFIFTEMNNLDEVSDESLFLDKGLDDISHYSLYKASKSNLDDFTMKYFGKKLNHSNHKDIYIEDYEGWAYFYADSYYFALLTGDAIFYLENHRIDNMKRLANSDIEIKTTTYPVGMAEEDEDEETLIKNNEGYNQNLLITVTESNGNYILKQVVNID